MSYTFLRKSKGSEGFYVLVTTDSAKRVGLEGVCLPQLEFRKPYAQELSELFEEKGYYIAHYANNPHVFSYIGPNRPLQVNLFGYYCGKIEAKDNDWWHVDAESGYFKLRKFRNVSELRQYLEGVEN